MTVTTKPRAPVERTEHPHVVKSQAILGGEPRVDGTRLAVRHIVRLIDEDGLSPAEVVADYSRLTLAQVYDALSYAHDHPEEMAYHRERHRLRNVMRKHGLVYYEGRLLTPKELAALEVPTGAVIYTWETLPESIDPTSANR